jgi:hypothetical protein
MHETLRFVVSRFGTDQGGSRDQGDSEPSHRPCHGATSQMLVRSLVAGDSLNHLAHLPDPHPGLSYPDALLVFLHRLGLASADRSSGTIALLSSSLDLSTDALRAELLSVLASDADDDTKRTRPAEGRAHLH